MQHNKFKFSKSRLSVVLAAAFAMPLAAHAATLTPPAAGTLPGNGAVTVGTSKGAVAASTLTITTSPGANVINWGATKNVTINANSATPGFNIGAGGKVVVNGAAGDSLLNVDVTGNPSQIYGTLSSPNPSVFVANKNGIVVGAGATIIAPTGLGLINADLSSSQAQAMFGVGNVPLSFTGATGGVTINAGADLSQVGSTTVPGSGFLLLAGAGDVNVTGEFLNTTSNKYVYSINPNASLVIDAGVGGYAAVNNGLLTVADKGTATALNKLVTTAANNVYATVAGNVTVALGTPTAAFNLSTGSTIAANGNITTSGNIANLGLPGGDAPFAWTGAFTNNGTLSWGQQTGATYDPTVFTGSATLRSTQTSIYANTTKAVTTGSVVNASGATLNAGADMYLTGASVDNEGAINLSGAGANIVALRATSGNVTLGGTVNLVDTGTTKYLQGAYLSASKKPGQTVNINTPLTLGNGTNTGEVDVYSTNLNVNSPVVVGGPSGAAGNFNFYPFASSARPIGNVNIASGAGISAGSVFFGGNGYTGPGGASLTNYVINAPVVATTKTTGSVTFGTTSVTFGTTSGATVVGTGNVNGTGSVGGDNITFNNLQGSVNNITTGQILANGFALNAGPSGTANISVTANGSAAQGFNVAVNGNAVVTTAGTLAVQTQAPATNSSATQYLYPANANSKMVVQATGTLTANAGTAASNYGGVPGPLFQFPGLIYLAGAQGITVNSAIANAYTTDAPVGYGVWVVGPTISDAYPVYANGGRGVNFVAPFANGSYGYATINGQPQGTGEPTVYFATPGNASAVSGANPLFSLQPTATFTNEKGYQQQNQVFLTVTPQ